MAEAELLESGTVIEALRDVYDPEIPVNVVDLGLIYTVEVADGDVHVEMTLTAPGCGMGPYSRPNGVLLRSTMWKTFRLTLCSTRRGLPT